MKTLIKFFLLPNRKRKLLIKALLMVWLIRLGLWLFSFKRLDRWLGYFDSARSNETKPDWEFVGEAVAAVRSSAGYVPAASCLTQALAVRAILKSKKQNSRLIIGIDKDRTKGFEAHAWIEIGDRIIIGKLPRHDQRFAVFNSSGSVNI